MTVEKALDLAEYGFTVFPVKHDETENTKKPLTTNGHLDATRDPGVIMEWWEKWPTAKVGVPTGENGIVAGDVDTKNGKDGWVSLDENFCDIPETFAYDTMTGGRHLIYKAPEGVVLNGQSDYRGMEGVDRRGGSSWVMWVGPVPDKPLAPAPQWLIDPAVEKRQFNFEGDLEAWYKSLVPGEPNALVRKAIERIEPDMSHSDMVEAQHSAIRLGAEGNGGVPTLLEKLQEAWLNRPAENHTTPESEWKYKFEEALASGLEKYGELTDFMKDLPEYSIQIVPTNVPDGLVTETDTGKEGFSRLLGALIKETDDDNRIASILWNCAATSTLARDWGMEFVRRRISEGRTRPEPTRENPRIEEQREQEQEHGEDGATLSLLTQEERDYIAIRPTFVDYYIEAGKSTGFANEKYFRAAGWNLASMAFSFYGFIPVTSTDKMGLNLWNMTLGESGTGKTRAIKFRDECADLLFKTDESEVSYNLGTDSSVPGLHEALLGRDRKASFFGADEASGFFKNLARSDWMSGLDDTLAKWYEGKIDPSNKVRLKELKGKSAMTSLSIQMFATPDRLTGILTRDMFLSGFLARFQWVIGDPPVVTDDRFNLPQQEEHEIEEFDEAPAIIRDVVSNLVSARMFTGGKAVPLLATPEALARMSEAYKRMFRMAEGRRNWDLVEPSVTRLMEAMRKCAGICAMYRESTQINMEDALHAIAAVEEWYQGLFEAADMISAGEFQRDCNEIEVWVRKKGGRVTKTALYHNFRNLIQRDPRELDMRINFLVESGVFNRDDSGGTVRYEVNG